MMPLINSLFDELKMLLTCLKTLECFKSFLVKIKHNILTYDELMEICKEYNEGSCIHDCKNCPPEKHPFCDLYNMGLLGIVGKPAPDIETKQKFKTPYEDFSKGLRGETDFFLIHPALREYINTLHNTSPIGTKYELYIGILIGAELPWSDRDTKLYYVNKIINNIKDVDLKEYYYGLLIQQQKNEEELTLDALKNILSKKKCSLYNHKILTSLNHFFLKGELNMPQPITVFISYAYDNKEHKEKVESFVDMLRQMGFDAKMDSMLKAEYPDIDQMMIYGLSCDKIIIVLSPEYKIKADNSTGGVWKEFKVIADDLEKNPKKYIFVSFDAFNMELKEKISPKRIGNRWIVDLEKGKEDDYNELIAFIKEEKEYPFSTVNKIPVSVKPKKIKPFK